jgi:hypothetical protein
VAGLPDWSDGGFFWRRLNNSKIISRHHSFSYFQQTNCPLERISSDCPSYFLAVKSQNLNWPNSSLRRFYKGSLGKIWFTRIWRAQG